MFAWRKTETSTEAMSIIGHLAELRQRIVRSMLAVALCVRVVQISTARGSCMRWVPSKGCRNACESRGTGD
jgi:Sec-independent protein secretion pathway component TatC